MRLTANEEKRDSWGKPWGDYDLDYFHIDCSWSALFCLEETGIMIINMQEIGEYA